LVSEDEMTLTCRQCGKQFVFTESEQQFYTQKGFTLPNHCKECRSIRRAQAIPVCSGCGKNINKVSEVRCVSCLETVRLELELERKKLGEALEESNARLSMAESEKVQLADTINAKIAMFEADKAQLLAAAETRAIAIESEKTMLVQESENKLIVAESEKARLAALLEQERRATAELQEKFKNACLELEKSLKYRAALDNLEPTLNSIKATLEGLRRGQEDIHQTLLQLTGDLAESPQSNNPVEVFKRFFRLGRKSASPVN
jgi:hypothetical protein